MGRIHNQIAGVRIPGLPEDTCYVDHLKKGFSLGRDHCVGGFRLLINAVVPFLYPNIQSSEFDSITIPPAPLVTEQPKKTD